MLRLCFDATYLMVVPSISVFNQDRVKKCAANDIHNNFYHKFTYFLVCSAYIISLFWLSLLLFDINTRSIKSSYTHGNIY